MNEFTIRKMEKLDCQIVVEIHLAAFQGFFLSFLGERFLTVFYKALLSDPSGIALIYENCNQIKGFVVGSDHPSGLYRNLLKKYWFEFAWASVGAFINKPSILPRLLRALTMPRQELPERCCTTLMSIAVEPKSQGLGVGKELVMVFVQEAKQRGSQFVNLTTDATNNESANKFYQRLGYSLFRTLTTPEGRVMNEYLLDLNRI